jgi:hypothetical protein
MNPSTDPRDALELGQALGQRRAFAAVGGRCTAAHAQLLRHVHDEKLYLPLAATWEEFCGSSLAISRRHADRIIALLNRFGPVYFEISQLVGISPREYLELEPAVRKHCVVTNGEPVSLIPEKAPDFVESLRVLLNNSRQKQTRNLAPQTLRKRARRLANQLVELYRASRTETDRKFFRETAAEIRGILDRIAAS